jgi:Mor family transcriptional regulator
MRYVWIVTLIPRKGDRHGGQQKQYALTEEDDEKRTEKVKELTHKYTSSGNWTYTVIRVRIV